MNIKDEELIRQLRKVGTTNGHDNGIVAIAADRLEALTAALPHMGGGSTKVFEHKGSVYFYEWRSDRWRNWWHFIGSQPVASHEPAPTDTQEGLSVTDEVVAFLVDCPVQPTLEFANVHVPSAATPLVRQSALTACQQEVERLRGVNADLTMQAKGHAQEARTANNTIYEIYQALSGATGEPGNWHGAEPARKYVESAEARNAELVKALKPFADAIFNDNGDVTCNYAAFDDDDLFRAYSLLKRAALKGQSNG